MAAQPASLPSVGKLVAIFDCNPAQLRCAGQEVGSYATLGCCAGASLLVFTQRSVATYSLLRWGLRSKIAASHNEVVQAATLAIALLLLPKGKNKASATEAATYFLLR